MDNNGLSTLGLMMGTILLLGYPAIYVYFWTQRTAYKNIDRSINTLLASTHYDNVRILGPNILKSQINEAEQSQYITKDEGIKLRMKVSAANAKLEQQSSQPNEFMTRKEVEAMLRAHDEVQHRELVTRQDVQAMLQAHDGIQRKELVTPQDVEAMLQT